MYGPGSAGWSATLTPTFQYGGFFFRGDLSFVSGEQLHAGYAFVHGHEPKPAEPWLNGIIFGNNIIAKKP